nr:hypothetical protein [Tanacetum cinerariifolium]
MLLGMKDEAGGTLNAEENDFMLDHAYGNDTLEELTAVIITMACNQPTDDKVILRQNMMLSLLVRLGYQNPKHIKKAIAAQPKMYDGERIHSTKLKINSSDSEETLEDTEES